LAKATREGKTVKLTGAEPPSVTATLFFSIPIIPLYFCPWFYHLCIWLVFQAILGRPQYIGEEKYWMMRQQQWSEEEYQEWLAKRNAYIEAQGGQEAFERQQAMQKAKYERMRKKYEGR